MIKPPFMRVKTFLLGKSASYRLNAYDDAAIAAHILTYVKTSLIPTGTTPVEKRAADLIAQTPDDHKDERLVVQAWTLFHLNGYADLMWSRFIERLARLEPPVTHHIYGDHEIRPIDLWFWIPPLLKKDVAAVMYYAREAAAIDLTLSYAEMVREVVRVQEANIAANRHTCQLLLNSVLPSNHPKVDTLGALAEMVPHGRIFMFSAARTQIAAGNWDRLAVWALRWRGA